MTWRRPDTGLVAQPSTKPAADRDVIHKKSRRLMGLGEIAVGFMTILIFVGSVVGSDRMLTGPASSAMANSEQWFGITPIIQTESSPIVAHASLPVLGGHCPAVHESMHTGMCLMGPALPANRRLMFKYL
jgi:hypothetical protein